MEFNLDLIAPITLGGVMAIAWIIIIILIVELSREIKKCKEVEEKPKKKNPKKILKKNRKDLIKRIKSMTPEQFDAYYETLIEIYGRECFYKTFSKRYVKKLMEK